MSNNQNKEKVEAVRQSVLEGKKEQYEFFVSLVENVSNVLSVSATIAITDQEVLMGQVNFTGEACLNIVYSIENGEILNHKTCENISGKIENVGIDPNVFVKILPNILDVTMERDEKNNLIKIKVSVEYETNMIRNQDLSIFTNTDQEIFVKENSIEISKHISRNCTNFNQTVIFDTKLPVKNILNITSMAMVTKADALEGMIVFEGEIATRVLYLSEDDRPVIVSLTSRESFREEVEDAKATPNSMVEAFARVICKNIDEEINKEEKTISVNVAVRLTYDLFESRPVTIIGDAYSVKNETNLTTEAFLSSLVSGCETVENRIDGNVTLDEKTPRIDKLLGVDGVYLTKTNQSFENGELQVSGLVHLNIIYINDEEENISSTSVEVPFTFKEKIEEGEIDIKTENELIEIDAVVKRGRDVYIDGRVKTSIWMNKEIQNAVISSIEVGEPLPEKDGSLEIYFANPGDTFWDVAKDLKISEETLKTQNATVEEPFANPEKLVYFEQKTLPEV